MYESKQQKGLLEMSKKERIRMTMMENRVFSVCATSIIWWAVLTMLQPFDYITDAKIGAFVTVLIIIAFMATMIEIVDIADSLRLARYSKTTRGGKRAWS